MPSILRDILQRKREEVSRRHGQVSMRSLEQLLYQQNAPRGFADALKNKIMSGRNAVIAEIKKASPSAGLIREDFDPETIAKQYQAGKAVCLSVLTDEYYFQGADAYLQTARAACDLPVLRKDFIVSHYQITETRALGADAILLIVAALSDSQLQDFSQHATELNLDVLVEVHNEAELERGLKLDQMLIGINNRDLHKFETDLETSERLVKLMPEDRLVVSESGIHEPEHIQRLNGCGINAFLVGESLMRQPDPGVALQKLLDI